MVVCHIADEIASRIPETAALLRAGLLVVHPRVYQINLEGSRGLRACPRHDSDIDLSLLVDDQGVVPCSRAHEALMREVLQMTLEAWQGIVELDLAACFDQRACGLACFNMEYFDAQGCPVSGGVDCCGLYKIQRGFSGYVPPFGVRMELLSPALTIWRRA